MSSSGLLPKGRVWLELIGSFGRSRKMSYTMLLFTFLLATTLHELGHVIGARISGIDVSTFSIGFGPVLVRTSHRGVTYQICMIPLGGYVMPSGSTITRPRRIVFLAAGLLTSIILVPVGCLSLLQVIDPSSSFVSGLDRLIAPWVRIPCVSCTTACPSSWRTDHPRSVR